MPVHKEDGGYQWGGHGKVYHGANAKEKAAAQGRAAYANGYRGKGKRASDYLVRKKTASEVLLGK